MASVPPRSGGACVFRRHARDASSRRGRSLGLGFGPCRTGQARSRPGCRWPGRSGSGRCRPCDRPSRSSSQSLSVLVFSLARSADGLAWRRGSAIAGVIGEAAGGRLEPLSPRGEALHDEPARIDHDQDDHDDQGDREREIRPRTASTLASWPVARARRRSRPCGGCVVPRSSVPPACSSACDQARVVERDQRPALQAAR